MRYSELIANSIDTYLREQDWEFTFDEIGGIFTVEADLSCKLGVALVVYQVMEDSFLCYTTIADEVPAEMRPAVAEYLHRANYGLPRGNFEFDYDEGSIHFKTFFECQDGKVTEKQLEESMAIGLTIFDHYGNGLYELLNGGSLARRLILMAEEQEG